MSPDHKEKIETLKAEIEEMRHQYKERESSIPAHSIRPHQILFLEEMEEQIENKEAELKSLIEKDGA